jgi:hypothetical protein
MQLKMETQELEVGFRQGDGPLDALDAPPKVFHTPLGGAFVLPYHTRAQIAALSKVDLSESQVLAVGSLLTLPILGFCFHPNVAEAVHVLIDSTNGFVQVDGRAYAAELIRPTVNGVLVPACAITAGTLLATTVNVLRNRQVEMRACISKEACELRQLRRAVFGMYGTAQHAARREAALRHMHAYTCMCVLETQKEAFDELAQQEQAGGSMSVNQLEEIAGMLHGIDGAAACRDFSVSSAQGALRALNGLRSDRLASLLSGFPLVHWLILGLLGFSIVVLFLIDSNQDVLQYLNSLQLRLLFSILLTTLCSIAGLCIDLADPFRGVTNINSASKQFADVQRELEHDLAEAEAEAARAPHERRGALSGARDTLYFHLLTGGVGSKVKVVGDMLAWGTGRKGLASSRDRTRRRQLQGKDTAPERGDAVRSKELLDPWHLKGARSTSSAALRDAANG